MIDKIILIAHLLFLGILLNSNCVSSISRDHKHNASSTNYSYYDNERESRQFPASGYGTGAGLGGLGGLSGYGGYGGLGSFGGPIEAIIIGLCVVFGLGIIGIPIFLLILTLFQNNGLGGGLNLVPTTTTTVAGRKRRNIESLLPEVNPALRQKLFNIFENFIDTPDKIKMIDKLLESVINRNH